TPLHTLSLHAALPISCERVIGLEAFELVPMIVNRAHHRLVGTMQIAAKLEVIWRIGENHVHGMIRQAFQSSDAITFDDGVKPGGTRSLDGQLMRKTYKR